jgi:phosphatidylglycerophosphate synthase
VVRLVTILTAYLSYRAYYHGNMASAWGWLLATGFVFGGTDYLDGKSARSLQVVSTFGKFVDPVADKLGIVTMLVLFAYSVGRNAYTSPHLIDWVITAVCFVIVVEAMLLMIAFIELSRKHVAGANRWGKDKVKVEIVTTALGSTLLFSTYYGLPHWIAPTFVCVASIPIIVFGLLSFYGHTNSLRAAQSIPERP